MNNGSSILPPAREKQIPNHNIEIPNKCLKIKSKSQCSKFPNPTKPESLTEGFIFEYLIFND